MATLKDKILEKIKTNKTFQSIATYSIDVLSNFCTKDNKVIVSSDNKIIKAKEE